jgi:hypothetical protein
MNKQLTQSEARNQFATDLNFWVDPSQIEFQIQKEFLILNDPMPHLDFFKYFIIDGDWDKDSIPVKEDRNYKDIQDIIYFGENYSQSESFRLYLLELIENQPQKDHLGNRFNSRRSVEASFEFYLGLIDSMRENGYVKKEALDDGKMDSDIGVAIGRLGELIHFRKGHHRLAIAKQIALERVAVEVQLVHSEWMKQEMRTNNCEESLAIKIGLRGLAVKHET